MTNRDTNERRADRTMRRAPERRREEGVALFLTVLILMLVGAIAIAAIEFSGEELKSGSRSRASARALFAADAGIDFALNRLGQSPPNLAPFNITLPNGVIVESRSRDDTTPQPIAPAGTGPAPAGYSINLGSGSGFSSELYLVNVTATSPGGTATELEVKVGTISASGGY